MDRGERQHQAGAAGEGALRLHRLADEGPGRGLGHRLRARGGAHHRPPGRRHLHHPAHHRGRDEAPHLPGPLLNSNKCLDRERIVLPLFFSLSLVVT